VDALIRIKASGRYDYYAHVHLELMNMMERNMMNSMDMPRNSPLFLPWHRLFIQQFESELGVAIPYWDWVAQSPSMWALDFMGGDGDQQGIVVDGAFSIRNGWICRVGVPQTQPGPELRRFLRGRQTTDISDDRLPTSLQINQCLEANSYDEFRQRVEDIDNIAHNWVGGSLGTAASPNDPVFYLNHTFVDYLWARWQSVHPNIPHFTPENMINTPVDFAGWLLTVPISQTLDYKSLGYMYDGLGTKQPPVRQIPELLPIQFPTLVTPPQQRSNQQVQIPVNQQMQITGNSIIRTNLSTTATSNLPDGSVKTVTILSDGSVKIVTQLSDGTVRTENISANGNLISGSVPLPSRPGDPVPRSTVLPDRSVRTVTNLPDGSVKIVTQLSDGSVRTDTTLSDGTVRTETRSANGKVISGSVQLPSKPGSSVPTKPSIFGSRFETPVLKRFN
jgi:tyrosinase